MYFFACHSWRFKRARNEPATLLCESFLTEYTWFAKIRWSHLNNQSCCQYLCFPFFCLKFCVSQINIATFHQNPWEDKEIKIHHPWETTENNKSRNLPAPFFLLPLNSRLEVLMADTCASTSVTIEVEAVDTWNNWAPWGVWAFQANLFEPILLRTIQRNPTTFKGYCPFLLFGGIWIC